MTALKIGEVARQAGVGVDTVRYYERRGVLPAAPRRASGYRAFTPATVERIRFAKELQELGFTLDEVMEPLHAADTGTASCASEQPRFEAVLARVAQKIVALRAVRRRQMQTLRRCRAHECTLLDEPLRAISAVRS
ncbi:MerR family transcriptional regulator [Polyangium sp. 15x6]|uniref:MerR family transcriptional regulator n=1 Tax=Polyangium sp. 15x6 TaxID=3042687 RepID=UPI00249C7323|nr:MerR family transcriptional regulator [Polyangium sp. 15x6]MDI3289300.1 MerR family transcriptional regulator [Polyangium sp. 15x6]